jgi:hypothetical protein
MAHWLDERFDAIDADWWDAFVRCIDILLKMRLCDDRKDPEARRERLQGLAKRLLD